MVVGLACPAAGTPSPGCSHPAPTRVPAAFLVSRVERQAIVVVPAGYHPDLPVPLVMAFHGRTNDNAQLRRYLDLEEAAMAPALFVYPAARRDRGGGFTWTVPDGSGPDLALFD